MDYVNVGLQLSCRIGRYILKSEFRISNAAPRGHDRPSTPTTVHAAQSRAQLVYGRSTDTSGCTCWRVPLREFCYL